MGGFALRHKLFQWMTLLFTAMILVLGYRELAQKYGMPEQLKQAQNAIEQKNYPRAIQLLEQYTSSNPGDEGLWLALGALYSETNQRDKAITAFQRALKVNPDSQEAKQALVELSGEAPTKE